MSPHNLLRNFPFAFESFWARRLNERFKRQPSSAPYLSGHTLRELGAWRFDGQPLASGLPDQPAILFVASPFLAEFATAIAPRLIAPFVLLTHQGDRHVTEEFRALADHPLLIRWFAQNLALTHPKVEPLPIGLENQFYHNNGHKPDFDALLRRRDFRTREHRPRIVQAFNLDTNPDERYPCYRVLWRHPLAVHFGNSYNSRLYRRELAKYAFVASPPGNGLDCHRTWEALYLRVIPIVQRNSMHAAFQALGLPLLMVDDWAELRTWDEVFLRDRYARLQGGFDHPALWFPWWADRIRAALEIGR